MSSVKNFAIGYAIGEKMDDRDKKREAEEEWAKLLESLTVEPEKATDSPAAGGISKKEPRAGESASGPGGGVGPKAGLTAAQAGPRPVFKAPDDLDAAREKLYQMDMLAAKHPGLAERANVFRNAYMQNVINQYQRRFDGDITTPAGLQKYLGYMAEGAAKLGKVMTPDEAKKHYDYIKQMKQEGFDEALKRFHVGDFKGGVNAWNGSGRERGEFVDYRPAKFNLAGIEVPGREVTYIDENGQKHTLNTAELLFRKMAFEKQVDLARKGQQDAYTRKDADRRYALDKERSRASARSIIAGGDDQYLVDKRTGEKMALGVGNKPVGKTPAGSAGMTPAQLLSAKKFAIGEWQTALGVSDSNGLQGLPEEDQYLYANGVKLIDSLITGGVSPGDAVKFGKKYQQAVYKLREAGEKNPEDTALRLFMDKLKGKDKQESGAPKDYTKLWR